MLSGAAGVAAEAAVGFVIGKDEAVVDDTVAIIVGIVAEFGSRDAAVDRYSVIALSGDAGLSIPAGSTAGAAVQLVVLQVETVVRDAVAVVVLVVADFCGRDAVVDWGAIDALTIHTILRGSAGTSAGAAVQLVIGQDETVVHDSITVIVLVVADFGGFDAAIHWIGVGALSVGAVLICSAGSPAGAAIR